ncbi:heavy metal translocating P-type ATPase [Desulfonema ishimotonii]|uniref:P-type Zn(2+) transporter n=1 Tax=Desulfonema ishimotonii TaxID=45657 RepID=A0A401G2V4_9BACT|nr:heavy metal translocating P-type ATPase [Desulfonema ishimotonii]GBC63513.1 heavy metal translocating P-type ATPase [Desulfonema ishimotonii]
MTTACSPPPECARIVHELPRRIRFSCPVLHNPALDTAYLEAMLRNIPGVDSVRINLRGISVVVCYDGDPTVKGRITALLNDLPEELWQPDTDRNGTADGLNVAARGIMTLLTPAIPRQIVGPLSTAMSLPTLAEGLETLLTRGVKVEVLDGAAVGLSLLRRDYFTANAIVALLNLGQYLEQLSEDRTTDLLRSLLRPRGETVWAERDGQEVSVPMDELVIGDLVICGPGELIPVDGMVAHGEASVNQSSITGESVPVHVSPASDVFSGSVVEEGRIKIEARQVGAETGMARISRFLETSVRHKSKAQKQSDALADSLVPITFGLGVLLYLITRDISRAASVLTVDYSCAIKVATPVAVKMGMFTAAHCGVLLKGAEAMDALSRVDTVVFDKTGTLTSGQLELTDAVPFNGISPDELLAVAAGAEAHYAHPVAKAVVRAAEMKGVELPPVGQVDFVVAHGVSAYVEEKRVLVGSHHFIHEDEGIDCSAADEAARSLREAGNSLLYVAREEKLVGVIALRDELRPESAQVLRDLKAAGIRKTVILTGDHKDTAEAIAAQLDALDEIHWELKPEDKARIVGNLREDGHYLAFVGDGVNDAPALVSAHVGICMPDGADLARESAQVVLLKEDMNTLVKAREIAVRTRQVIRNCFHSAVGLNSLILLFATTGRFSPLMSAILHNSSTIGILAYAALGAMQKPKAGVHAEES